MKLQVVYLNENFKLAYKEAEFDINTLSAPGLLETNGTTGLSLFKISESAHFILKIYLGNSLVIARFLTPLEKIACSNPFFDLNAISEAHFRVGYTAFSQILEEFSFTDGSYYTGFDGLALSFERSPFLYSPTKDLGFGALASAHNGNIANLGLVTLDFRCNHFNISSQIMLLEFYYSLTGFSKMTGANIYNLSSWQTYGSQLSSSLTKIFLACHGFYFAGRQKTIDANPCSINITLDTLTGTTNLNMSSAGGYLGAAGELVTPIKGGFILEKPNSCLIHTSDFDTMFSKIGYLDTF